jgi:predicted metal-binding protein
MTSFTRTYDSEVRMASRIQDDKLSAHISKCQQKAIELGASDTKIISIETLSIEDHIIEMCKPRLCEGYGKSANCPPHVIQPTEAREWIQGYRAALLFKIDVASELLLSEKRFDSFRKVYLMASELETLSIEAGYASSKALAAGSCKPVFCYDVPCEALMDGRECRFPSLSRPSMEALGINVFRLARDVGWEIHLILRDSDPRSVPKGMLAGLLLVS